MIFDGENDKKKEIIVNLKKYKPDEEFNIKCFVAHDYVQFEGSTHIVDKDDRGYFIKKSLQIPINVMAQLLKKLKNSHYLQKKHFNYSGYLDKDEVVLFEEWHLPKNSIARKEVLFRE